MREKQYDEFNLVVIETPGFFNTNRSPDENHDEIRLSLEIAKPHPHAFVLVLDFSPFTGEDANIEQLLIKIFGTKVFDYTIPVFVGVDKLIASNTTIDDFVKSQPSSLDNLLKKCAQHYMSVTNQEGRASRTAVSQLVTLIRKNLEEKQMIYSFEEHSFK